MISALQGTALTYTQLAPIEGPHDKTVRKDDSVSVAALSLKVPGKVGVVGGTGNIYTLAHTSFVLP